MSNDDTDHGWQRLSSRYLFKSQWYHVREDRVALPTGNDITYTVIEHPGYALVVPLLDDGRVVMERIYRYPLDRLLLECPSGGLAGDPPARAALRELEEETGFRAQTIEALGSFVCSTGISDEICHIFLAQGLTDDGVQEREETEQIELEFCEFSALVGQARAGLIEDSMSSLAILLADAYLAASR